jgi:Zn-dependent alcohol dehydrogenase
MGRRATRTVTAIAAALALAAPARALTPSTAVDQLKRDATSLITVDTPPTATQLALGLGLAALLASSDTHLVEQSRAHLPGWVDHFKTGGATGSANTLAVAHDLTRRPGRVTASWAPLPGGALIAAHVSF